MILAVTNLEIRHHALVIRGPTYAWLSSYISSKKCICNFKIFLSLFFDPSFFVSSFKETQIADTFIISKIVKMQDSYLNCRR